jgi:hypothetical protein
VLGQHVHVGRVLLGLGEQLDLGQRLVREGVGHHERRVTGGVAQVQQAALGEDDEHLAVGELPGVHLRLDLVLDDARDLREAGHVEVADVAHDRLVLHPGPSSPDTAPVITVRDWTGSVLVELEHAGISRLEAAGWSRPERFRVTSADGKTDIYGLLYLPPRIRPRPALPRDRHPLRPADGQPGEPVLRPRLLRNWPRRPDCPSTEESSPTRGC